MFASGPKLGTALAAIAGAAADPETVKAVTPADVRTRLAALATERVDQAEVERASRAELAELEVAVTAAEGELTARGDTDLSDEMVRVEQLRERARGIAAVLVERRRSMERDRGQLMDSGVIANLEGEAERLRAELVEVEADLQGLGPEAEALAGEEAAFAAQNAQSKSHSTWG